VALVGWFAGAKSKPFFFEKKNQKTFACLRARCVWRGPQE